MITLMHYLLSRNG